MNDNNENQDGVECGVRDKYAKPWNANGTSFFQLYTTFSKPGLVSIFYNEDQRSFHNWGLEVGSGPKRGRIREAIDHQINTPVLEIAGDHNGSVFMMCPPDAKSTINVDMPYVTMLMKDMNGYSSVEFTVLDTLGFSRKISAKNFKSRCTIGELNCEIPMRLSPTWNYACVNLDETLRNAFGTKLVTVQRIKINANVRVRRIYFHEEIFPFKSLPQEFRIKLVLTPQEKQEIHMYEDFLYSEPTTSPERNIPWCMPRVMAARPASHDLRSSAEKSLHATVRRKVEILEVPLAEDDEDKYSNIGDLQTNTNTGLLREMLLKSIPPSKILLPTLSLIYPDKKDNDDAAFTHAGKTDEHSKTHGHHGHKHHEGIFFGTVTESSHKMEDACGGVEEKAEHLRKMKKCIETETPSPRVDVKEELEDSAGIIQPETDWEKFHHHHHHRHHTHRSKHNSGPDEDSRPNSRNLSPDGERPHSPPTSGATSSRSEHHRHNHTHGCGKFTVTDLAEYLKHRELYGDYDMFSNHVGNEKFLKDTNREGANELTSENGSSDGDFTEMVNTERRSTAHGENPFVFHQREGSAVASRRSSKIDGIVNITRRSTISRIALQDPAKVADEEVRSSESGIHSTESWLLTWAYNGVTWAKTREINQKLLNDAKKYFGELEHSEQQNKKSRKSIVEAGISLQQQQQGVPSSPSRNQRAPQKLPEVYRCAVPILPRAMKEELRGTGGYYDIIVDNPTLPIDHY